ncbi:hypothetical protein CJF42_05770 [Pseudoalteromonas sp. NBT06-2]|uniref:hypothetical protein n=1 Tax=Pseudoalteromonas sp. NBT06-2 TaxID=2025950 RepID=UPI000BA55F86|nr:hypothetical protein [Pseudoalteromonas sp. NBT06-2]PAJ75349.1 hypothetical protein CJF42_05770 [Pseudoalteromonas sp. NBT06-2]
MSIISNQLFTTTGFKLFEEIFKESNLIDKFTRNSISERVQSVYSELSIDVKSKELDFYNKIIQEIIDIPIEVEIEQDEMKLAILFSRLSLGIGFLKVKEIEVKIDMLTLTGQHIKSSTALTQSDKYTLLQRIKDLKAQLEEQKTGLMKENTPEELEPFKEVDFKQINPLYNKIQESNIYLL